MTPMNCFFLLSQSNDSLNLLTSKDWISEWYSMIKTRYWVGQMSPSQDCKSCSRSPLLRHRHVPLSLWLCQAPPSLWLCLYPQWLRLCCGLPDPCLRLGRLSLQLHFVTLALLLLGYTWVSTSSVSIVLPQGIFCQSSTLPPSSLPQLHPGASSWLVAGSPPGSSCSWLLPPSTPPWFLPLSPSPSLCLSPAPRPPPEPPLSLFSCTYPLKK